VPVGTSAVSLCQEGRERRLRCPDQDHSEDDATSVDTIVHRLTDEDGDVPDLHAARGVIPAILIGAALWAAVIVAVALLW
jgi:hypothetical protein